jgi:hypothetical protein
LGGGEFTLGVAYGFGSSGTEDIFGDPGDEIIEPLPSDARLQYRTMRLIVAFAF